MRALCFAGIFMAVLGGALLLISGYVIGWSPGGCLNFGGQFVCGWFADIAVIGLIQVVVGSILAVMGTGDDRSADATPASPEN